MNQGDERSNTATTANDGVGERDGDLSAHPTEATTSTIPTADAVVTGFTQDNGASALNTTSSSSPTPPNELGAVEQSLATDEAFMPPIPPVAVSAEPGVESASQHPSSATDAPAAQIAAPFSDADPSSAPPDAAPLEPGAQVGPYTIIRLLRHESDGPVYLAQETSHERIQDHIAEWDGSSVAESPFVTLLQRPIGSFSSLNWQFTRELRHPRLLGVRAILPTPTHDYLALDALAFADATLAPTASEGGRLAPNATLTTGAGLADALAYLHRNNVAHLHISPDTLLVFKGRAYLTGIETLEYVGALDDVDSAALFARDANYLARSLGALAGLSDQPSPAESAAETSLRQIVAHGAAGAFTSPAELGATCGASLQTTFAPKNLAVANPVERLQVLIGSASSVGRVRSENQDATATFVFETHDDIPEQSPLGLVLVADGMGGEARGEVASRIAARIVSVELLRIFALPTVSRPANQFDDTMPLHAQRANGAHSLSELAQALTRATLAANQQVRELSRQLGQTTGTTLTAIAIRGSTAALAHLGDSRAYLLRDDQLTQLTEDHSVLARLQAIDHPLLSDSSVYVPRNMLYRSLGQEDDLVPDLLELTLAPGDRLMLCSDGLWDELDDTVIARELSAASDPRACSERLVFLANASGGHDNSTAVVAFVLPNTSADTTYNAASASLYGAETADEAGNINGATPSAGDQSHMLITDDAPADAQPENAAYVAFEQRGEQPFAQERA